MNRFQIKTSEDDFLEKALEFIRKALEKKKISKSHLLKTELLAEETIVLLTKHAREGAELRVNVSAFLGEVSIDLSMKGEEFELESEKDIGLDDVEDADAEDAIRSVFLRAYGEKYKYSHYKQINKFRILVEKSGQQSLFMTLFAIALGGLTGFLLRQFAPVPVTKGLCTYLLEPVKTMFMNALNIVIGPVIFFSLTTCISQFKNLAELGKVAAKIMTYYMSTTIIAIILGIVITSAVKPGDVGFAKSQETVVADNSEYKDYDEDISLIDTIVNIVPNNVLSPFSKSDTLQIMFLAILIGLVLGMIGEYSVTLKGIFEACNSLFLTITTLIAKLVPLAVFSSVALLIINSGMSSIKNVLAGAMTTTCIMLLMICMYGVIIFVVGKINPIRFFNNIKESMVTSLSLCSSSASMPTNLDTCTRKLGIMPAISSFTIPLGATINMDGTSISLASCVLFLARAYGVDIPLSELFPLAVTIMLLSFSAPGVPGNLLICMGIVLAQADIPMEAIGIIIAINPILDMVATVNNITGDIAGTLLVAKSEGKVDWDIFYGRKKG